MELKLTLNLKLDDMTIDLLQRIEQRQGVMEMKIDDLKAAVEAEAVEISHLTDAVAEGETSVQTIITNLKALQGSTTTDADIDGVIASLTDHVTSLQGLTAGLKAFNPA